MADVMELLDHIRREQDNFPAAQKKVAAFVVENYQQIAFLPISALSQRVGVSDNTVIKFCNHLGYEKFTEFKKEFTSYAHSELLIYNKIGGETAPVSEGDSVWSMIQNDAIASLQETLSDPQNHSSLTELLARMEKAKHIYVTGGRLSGIAAAMLANKLRYLNLQVHDLSCGTVGDYIDQTALVQPEDLVKFGFIPEFIGRLPVVCSLAGLTESDLVHILTKTKNSLIKQYSKLLSLDGAKLRFTDGAVKAIARKAMDFGTGARALRSIMESVMLNIMYELPDQKKSGEVVIDESMINSASRAE